MIRIIYYEETIDNWGRTNSSDKPQIIRDVLKTPEEWTDDMRFTSEDGQIYFIDDLIGKEVFVGATKFMVTE